MRFEDTLKVDTISIDVDPNTITLNGSVLQRPTSIPPSVWMNFWDKIRDIDNVEEKQRLEGYREGLKDHSDCYSYNDLANAREEGEAKGISTMKERFQKIADSIKDLL